MKNILLLLFFLLASSDMFAQGKRIAVFLHGFGGNASAWTVQSEIPAIWKQEGTIDESVTLEYQNIELTTSTAQAALITRFLSELQGKAIQRSTTGS